MLENTQSQATEQARHEVQRRTTDAKEELGTLVLDLAEEYFPEQSRARRRKTMSQAFLTGAFFGFLLGIALGSGGE